MGSSHQYHDFQARDMVETQYVGWEAPTLCIVASSSRESAESWLAWDGRWEGRDTHHTATAVKPRTFRCCRRAVAALLLFCKWKNKTKAGYQVPIPLSIALPHAMPQSTKGLQDGSSQDGQLDIQLVPKPAALKEEAPC